MAEHPAVNRMVAGSSPAAPAKKFLVSPLNCGGYGAGPPSRAASAAARQWEPITAPIVPRLLTRASLQRLPRANANGRAAVAYFFQEGKFAVCRSTLEHG